MASRIERGYMYKIRELLGAVPDVKNNADIKSISEFRKEMLFVREKLGWALYWLAERHFEEVDKIITQVEEYLKSREILWNEEVL